MFYVVAFLDDSVEVVPNNWLSDCGTWCHWPPFRGQAMTDAICQKKVPDHRWKKAEIKKIMRKCGMFYRAIIVICKCSNMQLLYTPVSFSIFVDMCCFSVCWLFIYHDVHFSTSTVTCFGQILYYSGMKPGII